MNKDIKWLAKKWMYLLQQASAEVVNLGLSERGAGTLPVADLVDISSVVHGFRLITCPDSIVQELARLTLKVIMRCRIEQSSSEEDYLCLLTGRLLL